MNGKIVKQYYVERRLGSHLSLIGRGFFVLFSGIGKDFDVFVVVGGTPGAGRAVDDDVFVRLPGNGLGCECCC